MKVLIDHPTPFLLAHGGFQVQIEQTIAALRTVGVTAEHLRWWDEAQTGKLIHFFGRPSAQYVQHAHGKGMRVVVSELLTEVGSRTLAQRTIQKTMIRGAKMLMPEWLTARFAWDSLQLADACVALTPWEARLFQDIFGVSSIHI